MPGTGRLMWLGLGVLLCGFSTMAQSTQPAIAMRMEGNLLNTPQPTLLAGGPLEQGEQRLPGTVSGSIVDRTGTAVNGARVKLTREDQSLNQEQQTGDDGRFSFANVTPGPFQISITAEGFATQSLPGTLHSGENSVVPQITLALATTITEVTVSLSPVELAQEQLQEQEKQRVLGFIPNFYVSYVPNAAPLNTRQKFQLAWKTSVDPVSFLIVGAIAGGDQATNRFSGYGQGAAGYGRRYGASYGDFIIGTYIGAAVLPSLLKQDPRYFYKGTGTKKSRFLYAIANSVICKGDNGRWQPAYSGILGNLAAGGISNLYYPEQDRNGAALTFENALIGIGGSAIANVLQEFVLRRLTPNVP